MLTAIKLKFASELCQELGLPADEVVRLFEIPKDINHGHLSLPLFFLAKERKKAPALIAKELAEKLLTNKLAGLKSIHPVGGYLNFHLDDGYLFKHLYDSVLHHKEKLGHTQDGNGRRLVIDYSSPNVAKPMHVGHLRASCIGQAIRNLAETQGYEVIGLNHLGDWGVQFGKLAHAYKLWAKEYPFETEPFESLFKLYVRFHQEVEANPELEKAGSAAFKKLEDGDPELLQLWQMFVAISMTDFERQWTRLGVQHDLVRGESFYNERLSAAERRIEEKGLLVESDGAMVVKLDDENMPPCLIRKTDGASLYATRDIASAIYRIEELKADLNLYVVGMDQTLHFKQVFSVLRRAGFSWWDKCHHISFGMYRFKDVGKMSSRKGQIIRLDDVINKAIEMVKKVINQKNPNLKNMDRVAEQVAIGAIIFNDLVNDRVRDVDFDWEKAVSLEGDSGPYLQYVYARCQSVINKWDSGLPETVVPLETESERSLIKMLLLYEEALAQSFKHFKPNILATYLLDVASAFNKFYHEHRIIGGEEKFISSRIALLYCAQQIIHSGLRVLSIETPEAM